jgi:hypothetical protein
MSHSRARGLIRHEVFGTVLARPNGRRIVLFLSECLIHVTRDAGVPEAAPV